MKKVIFFYELKKEFKIQKYKENYIDMLNKYQEYNLENIYSLNNIKQDLNDKDENIEEEIEESIKALSYVNMIRCGKPQELFDSKAMLITNTKVTNCIARHKEIMESKNIPLSNHLDFITARLWEFIETSLGDIEKIVSFNPIFNIQITLKEILQENLSKQYIRAENNYQQDNDKDKFIQEIVDIQDKLGIQINDKSIEYIETILVADETEEERKLQAIEREKSYKEGMDFGREQGRKEAEREFRRKQKKDNYLKRLKVYKRKQCKKNIKNIKNKMTIFIKKHIQEFILTILYGLITAFIWSCFNAN